LRKCLLSILVGALGWAQPLIVRTGTLIDGKGKVLRNQEIAIAGALPPWARRGTSPTST
jgi:hypothetical protein